MPLLLLTSEGHGYGQRQLASMESTAFEVCCRSECKFAPISAGIDHQEDVNLTFNFLFLFSPWMWIVQGPVQSTRIFSKGSLSSSAGTDGRCP